MFAFKRTLTPFKFFLSPFKTHPFNLIYIVLIIIRVKNSGDYLTALNFCVSFSRISSATLLTMALFSC